MKINSIDLCDMLFGAFIGVSLTVSIVVFRRRWWESR